MKNNKTSQRYHRAERERGTHTTTAQLSTVGEKKMPTTTATAPTHPPSLPLRGYPSKKHHQQQYQNFPTPPHHHHHRQPVHAQERERERGRDKKRQRQTQRQKKPIWSVIETELDWTELKLNFGTPNQNHHSTPTRPTNLPSNCDPKPIDSQRA